MTKPILFNTDMVRAILDGRKTVTRRVVKPQPPATSCVRKRGESWDWSFWADCDMGHLMKPPYQPGDILYVRETWAAWSSTYGVAPKLYYKADGDTPAGIKWHPSIHMPKEAARLFLRVTDVRVDRLQDITPEQARAEGCDGRCNCPSSGSSGSLSCVIRDFSVEKFETVWDGTIKPADHDRYGWTANPWVWVIEFERVSKEAALKGGEG